MSKMYYNNVDTGVIVGRVDLGLRPDSKIDEQSVAYRHGTVVLGRFYHSRPILVTGYLMGDDSNDFRSKLDFLNKALDSDKALPLRFTARYPDRYWLALLEGESPLNQRNTGGAFELTFIAPDPLAYALDVTETVYTITQSPQEIFHEGGGSGVASPSIYIENFSETNVTSVGLEFEEVGAVLTWGGTLAQGDILWVDTERMLVKVSTDGGVTWAASMTGLGDLHVFPSLSPDMNTINVTGVETGELKLEYRKRYL